MCQLTEAKGDFWRKVHAHHAEPTTFMGYTLFRSPADQARIDMQARRRADTAVRELCTLEANNKAVFETLEGCAFRIGYRKPHLRAQLCDAYRSGDHAELGRIIAVIMREELEEKAEDAAADECEEVELAERAEQERSAA